ncbi:MULTISPECIES: hypothetical protein [Moorena]|uniref:hypothetical protein n=1 Tax=Moorena TaxID=1155738 RepID=UPI0002EDEC7A|nr:MULTISPECIES: hypothetical protein [Moorena]NEQ15683.1 hypothetical protein [Moorena sp. SIO3E2]NEP35446.1 hypothetical protein [Moorena sp. SIO3B2]NEP66911.1 hypothetical protein [Moorena sp. SIO3A5]NEQ10295.1 hypothetical protein [Moorena sp. SIO4E2]NER88665.1 hypothetical protein [Moorena sp. SIO3A2]
MGKNSLVILIGHYMITLPTLPYSTLSRVGKNSLVILIGHYMITLPTLPYLWAIGKSAKDSACRVGKNSLLLLIGH